MPATRYCEVQSHKRFCTWPESASAIQGASIGVCHRNHGIQVLVAKLGRSPGLDNALAWNEFEVASADVAIMGGNFGAYLYPLR